MLEVKGLEVSLAKAVILRDFSLRIDPAQIVALTGPNGSGKSSLAFTLVGHPAYQVTAGQLTYEKNDLTALKPEERARRGIFLAYQNPVNLPGTSVAAFLHQALLQQKKARGEAASELGSFLNDLKVACRLIRIPWEQVSRPLDSGFSGGERKKLELLQLLILKPKLAVLDELDAGLDQASLEILKKILQQSRKNNRSTLLISHNPGFLKSVRPEREHSL